ncbi:MAG: TlpA family protein disulfide reductase [Acidobacteria bacterium]|nr:MAG: TlpA family protein disulfide reductase [Acidobacteriota bacterium]
MQRPKLIFIPLLILLVGLSGCSPKAPEPTPEEATRVHVGDQAPAFNGHLMDGTPFSLEAQRGKVVVLSFFATWCPPCREEIPHLESEVWTPFRGPDFVMVAIAREHKASDLGEFITQMEMTFPVLPDPDRGIFSLFADAFIPRTIVIDPEGRVIFHGTDYKAEEFTKMVELIEATVAANSSAALLTTDS